MKKSYIAVVVLATVGILLFGANHYLWLDKSKKIDNALVLLEKEFEKEGTTFKYESLSYNSKKFWDVEASLKNITISKDDQYQPISLNIPEVTIKDDTINGIVEIKLIGDMKYKSSSPYLGDDDITISFLDKAGVLNVYYIPDLLEAKKSKFSKLEYMDNGSKMIDNKTQKEIASAGPSHFSIGYSIIDGRENVEFILSSKDYKTNYQTNSEPNPMLGDIFKDIPEFGNHNTSMNIMLDAKKIGMATDFKVLIRELKYSNDIFNYSMEGNIEMAQYLPTLNMKVVIGNYEKIIDMVFGIYQNAKTSQFNPDQFTPVRATQEQINNFKAYLGEFKVNATDIKFEILMDNTGKTTISGKPFEEVIMKIDGIFKAPAPAITEVPEQPLTIEPSIAPSAPQGSVEAPQLQIQPAPVMPQQ